MHKGDVMNKIVKNIINEIEDIEYINIDNCLEDDEKYIIIINGSDKGKMKEYTHKLINDSYDYYPTFVSVCTFQYIYNHKLHPIKENQEVINISKW